MGDKALGKDFTQTALFAASIGAELGTQGGPVLAEHSPSSPL